MHYFAGLDWAKEEHALCVVDQAGKKRGAFTISHTASGLGELKRALAKLGAPEDIPVAIERPTGVIVDWLVELGHPVFPVHPNVVKAARPRYGAALAKSDAGDAFLLADLLRTDGHRFRRLQRPSDETHALRALVRTREDLVLVRVGLANQLRSLLEGFWPGAIGLFVDIDSAISLAFCERFPTPSSAAELTPKRLARFLKDCTYSGRTSPAELLRRIASAPHVVVGQLEEQAKSHAVLALVGVLKQLVAQIGKLTSAVDAGLEQHPDGRIVASLPWSGRVNAAQILAELGDDRGRYASEDQLAAESGVAPVTRASGKHFAVCFRMACNKRLRRAVTTFADNSRHGSPWAAAIYGRARGRTCSHQHAVRVLARAWIRVLWRCWQDRRPYDPALHRAAARLAAEPAKEISPGG